MFRISAIFVTSVFVALPGELLFAEEGGKSRAIEEIVVTAQKTEQSINDVPISISALDGEQLDDAGVSDITNMIAYVPGLNGSTSGLVTQTWNIRSIGTNDWSTGSEPAVAVFLDEAYIGRNVMASASFFDVERIEVLKGPQGTLFGRNASAGAINIITRKPEDRNSLYLSYGAGNEGQRRMELVGNLAATETFALRLAVLDRKFDGIQKNILNGEDLFQKDTAARLTARWDVTDRVQILLSGHYNEADANTTRPHNPGLAGLLGLPGGNETFAKDITNDSPSGEDVEGKGLDLRIGWSINETLSFTSITDWRKSDLVYQQDVDGVGESLFVDLIPDLPGALFFDGPTYFLQPSVADETFSQEFRLNGSSGAFDWFVGASYFTEDVHEENRFSWPLTIDLDALVGGGGVVTVLTEDNPTRSVLNGDNTSWGIYTDVAWHLSERFTLNAGLRWTKDKKKYCSLNEDPTFGIVPILGPDTGAEICDSKSWDKVTPRVVASFDVTEDVMLYASFTQGYKGGGYNTTVQGVAPDFSLAVFDPETSDAWEGGMKASFLENSMQLNVSGYFIDYKDFQLLDTDLSLTISNIGDVESRGVEAEWMWIPTYGLTIQANVVYNKSEIKAPGFSIDGSTLPQAPRWASGLSANYEWSLGNTGSLSAFLGYNWVDDMIFDVNGARVPQKAYGVLDASLQYTHGSGRWHLTLSGRNLTDEAWIMAAADPLGLGTPSNNRSISRFIMLRLGVSLGDL